MPFDLTLKPHENYLNGIVMYEPINRPLLEKLIHSDLLKETFRNPFVSYQNEKKQLEAYRELINPAGYAVVSYNKSQKNPFGRCDPAGSLGLHSIRREIRHTLAEELYIDVDIENAHPQVLLQICRANGIPCENLTDYCNNRQKWLDFVVEKYLDIIVDKKKKRDIAKKLFIRLMYGGGFKKWRDDWKLDPAFEPTGELVLFIDEFKFIQEKITNANPAISKIVKIQDVEKKKNWEKLPPEKQIEKPYYPKNIQASTTSFYLQEWEVRILECCYIYLIDNGYIKDNVGSLCADGLMIMKENYKESLLDELSDLVKREFEFDLKFATKDFDEGYNKIIDKHIEFDLRGKETGKLADFFYMMNGNEWVNQNSQVYFYNNIVWCPDDKEKNHLSNFVDTTFNKQIVKYLSYKIKPLEEELQRLLVNKKQNKELIKGVEAEIAEMVSLRSSISFSCRTSGMRSGIIKDIVSKINNTSIIWNKNPYIFAFKNKIFDLRNGEFVKPNSRDYINQTCGYNWVVSPYNKKEKLNKMLDEIYPDPEIKNWAMLIFATGLCGIAIQYFFVDTGVGGNGKSFINELMLATAGEYGYKLPSSILFTEIKDGANPQIANLKFKRFVYCEEPSAEKRMKSSCIKELTGGSTINARLNHSNDCKIELCLTFKMGANKIPNFDKGDGAVDRRLRPTPYESLFLTKEDYDNTDDKTNRFLRNPKLAEPQFNDEYRMVFFDILKDYFVKWFKDGFPERPDKCKEIQNVVMANSDDLFGWFSNLYEEDKNEVVKVKSVFSRYSCSEYYSNLSKQDKRNFNETKFKEMLKENFHLKKSFTTNKDKVHILKGWKLKEVEDEINDE